MDSSTDLLATRPGKSKQVCVAAFSSLCPIPVGQRAFSVSITGLVPLCFVLGTSAQIRAPD